MNFIVLLLFLPCTSKKSSRRISPREQNKCKRKKDKRHQKGAKDRASIEDDIDLEEQIKMVNLLNGWTKSHYST